MLRLGKEHQVENNLTLPSNLEHLSFSSLDTFLTCPRRFYFRYIEGIKTPPAIFLTFGDCGHQALEFNNRYKFENGNDLPEKVIVDKFCDTFAVEKVNIEDWDGENPDVSYDKHIKVGQRLLSSYMKGAAPLIKPIAIPEQEVTGNICGVKFLGYIDLEDQESLLDYKFVKNAKKDGDVKASPQMWIYSFLKKKNNVGMISMCKESGAIESANADIDDRDHTWLKELVRGMVMAITAGVFFPRKPDGQEKWQCTPKFCGYYAMCRGRRSV